MIINTVTFTQRLIRYYFTSQDLAEDLNLKRLKVSRKALAIHRGKSYNLRTLCIRMFIYFLYLVLLDIIKNNVTFTFPTLRKMMIGVRRITDENEVLEHMRKYDNTMYDVFGAGFTIPIITLFYEYKYINHKFSKNRVVDSSMRMKDVGMSYRLTKIFFDNINSGKRYG